MENKVNEADVIKDYCKKALITRKKVKVFPNTYINGFEGDILEVSSSGYLIEIEVKLTRSDLFNDIKKATKYSQYGMEEGVKKYDLLQNGFRCNTFFYLVPKGMVKTDELPVDFAGLVEFAIWKDNIGNIRYRYDTKKSAERLSKEKLGTEYLVKLLESTYYRFHTLYNK